MRNSLPPKIAMINSALIVLLFVLFALFCLNQPKPELVRYVDNVQLFNAFNMSKDLSKIHNDRIKNQVVLVDSLYKNFQLSIKNEEKEIILKREQLNFQKENQKLQEMQEYFSKEVSQQVWNRLNLYMKDYGTQYKYQLILGTQGNGNIMYADSIINITDDLLEYCNTKYEGLDASK